MKIKIIFKQLQTLFLRNTMPEKVDFQNYFQGVPSQTSRVCKKTNKNLPDLKGSFTLRYDLKNNIFSRNTNLIIVDFKINKFKEHSRTARPRITDFK